MTFPVEKARRFRSARHPAVHCAWKRPKCGLALKAGRGREGDLALPFALAHLTVMEISPHRETVCHAAKLARLPGKGVGKGAKLWYTSVLMKNPHRNHLQRTRS